MRHFILTKNEDHLRHNSVHLPKHKLIVYSKNTHSLNRYIYTLVLVVVGVCSSVRAQDSLAHFYLTDTSVALQEQVCLPLRVNNFDSIEAFQLSINFDPYLLDFDSIGHLNADIGLNLGFGLQEKHLGIIRLVFFDPFTSHTLADSAVLFTICYTAYGLTDELCPVNIANFPLPLEVISMEQEVDATSSNAIVDIIAGSNLELLSSACKTGLNDSTGSLSFTVYGGNPPYFAIWQHTFNSNFSGGFGIDTFGETYVLNNLIEGRYRISITDEDGSRIRDSLNVIKANDLTYFIDITNPVCDNDPTGSIRIDSLTGGIRPSQFKWSDGELFSKTRKDLSAGDYYLTITSPLGCRTVDTFLLESTTIQANVQAFDESCLNKNDGSFILSASGGHPINGAHYLYVYKSDTISASFLQDSQLAVGDYEIQIIDSLGCAKFVDIEIGTGLSFGISEVTVVGVNCFGESSASIFLRPKTLTGDEILPYSFDWTGTDSARIDSASILLDNLSAGTYTISISNASIQGCSIDTTFIISQPPFLSVATTSIVPSSCVPGDDGEARIQITGGTPDGDGKYFISWDNGEDSTVAVSLSAGLHTIRVLDLNGCLREHEVEIPTTDPPGLIGSSIRDFRCDSLPVGSILTVFSSPFGIDSYEWSTGDMSSSIDNLIPGVYTCIVTDRNGCIDTFSFDAPAPMGPEISDVIVNNIQCFGDTNGRIDIIYNLGPGTLDSITWNGNLGGDSLINLRSGGYRVKLYDTNGCVDSAATTLVNPEVIHITYSSLPDSNLLNTGTIAATVTGGWSPYSFSWTPGTHRDSSFIDNLAKGTYYLTLVDAEGCAYTDSVVVDFVSGIYQYSQDVDYSIFPNPSSSYLNLDWHLDTECANCKIVVFGSLGQQQYYKETMPSLMPWQLDISEFAIGQYWLAIISEGKVVAVSTFHKN